MAPKRASLRTAAARKHSGGPASTKTHGTAAAQNPYPALSLRDLLDARDQYHVHQMRHPNVVATAIGYYRIRHKDTPPGVTPKVKGTGPRTLANSEVRSYS